MRQIRAGRPGILLKRLPVPSHRTDTTMPRIVFFDYKARKKAALPQRFRSQTES